MTKTTFISLNGQLVEVPVGSPQALAYLSNAVTDIGDPDNVSSFPENPDESSGDAAQTDLPEVTPDPTVTPEPMQQSQVELLENAVELLAENSTTVTGTVNSTVLGIMDRIIDGYPDFYEYAGFRIDSDDAYRSTLYISKHAKYEDGVITFGDDCIAVQFYRYSNNYASSYVYYDIEESPDATVTVNNDTIVYTNTMVGAPHLGTVTKENDSFNWIAFFVSFMLVIFLRRKNYA